MRTGLGQAVEMCRVTMHSVVYKELLFTKTENHLKRISFFTQKKSKGYAQSACAFQNVDIYLTIKESLTCVSFSS